jgi:hypothetical protein
MKVRNQEQRLPFVVLPTPLQPSRFPTVSNGPLFPASVICRNVPNVVSLGEAYMLISL